MTPESLRIALRGVGANKLRSALTVLGSSRPGSVVRTVAAAESGYPICTRIKKRSSCDSGSG